MLQRPLGYGRNPQDAIRRHCKKDGYVNYAVIDSVRRTQQAPNKTMLDHCQKSGVTICDSIDK